MNRIIFVNLPVADVAASRRFYTGLGFAVNDRFSDEKVACIVVSDTIVVMLIDHDRFRDFVTPPVADRHAGTVLNGLSTVSRQEVDSLVTRAVQLGGTAGTPSQDGEMYGHSFTDPDGHTWELLHMPVPPVAPGTPARRPASSGSAPSRTPASRTPPSRTSPSPATPARSAAPSPTNRST